MELICQCGHYQSSHRVYVGSCRGCNCKEFIGHQFEEIDKMPNGSMTVMTVDTANFLNSKSKEKKLMNENKRNEIDGAIMAQELWDRYLLEIPSEPVSRHYVMDPKTEDLINGEGLTRDMIVLIEDITMRGDLTISEENRNDFDRDRIASNNHWCRVTEIGYYAGNSDIRTFIGIYADGTKRSRTYNKAFYWFVKK